MLRRTLIASAALLAAGACSSGNSDSDVAGQAGGLGAEGPEEPVIASMHVVPVFPGGMRVTLAATADHPGSRGVPEELSWEVDWGDGTPVTSLRQGSGARNSLHRYADRTVCGPTGWCDVTLTVCNGQALCTSRSAPVPIGLPQVSGNEGDCDFTCRGRWGWQEQSLGYIAETCGACDDRADQMCEGRGTRQSTCRGIPGQITPRPVGDNEPPQLRLLRPEDGALLSAGPHEVAVILDSTDPSPFGLTMDDQVEAVQDFLDGALNGDDTNRVQLLERGDFVVVHGDLTSVRGELDVNLATLRNASSSGAVGINDAINFALDLLLGAGTRRGALPLVIVLGHDDGEVVPNTLLRATAAGAVIRTQPGPTLTSANLRRQIDLRAQPVLAHPIVSDNREVASVRFQLSNSATVYTSFDPPWRSNVLIPELAVPVFYDITATARDTNGNEQAVTHGLSTPQLIRDPVIESVTPLQASPGDTVRLRGRYFSSADGQNIVFVGPPQAVADTETRDTLTFAVPTGAVDGEVFVVAEGVTSNTAVLRIDTDRDTLPDNDEIRDGTDPNDPDSDDDGVGDAEDQCQDTPPDRDGVIRVEPDGCRVCENGVFDGLESDTDCGGPCDPCVEGDRCNVEEDCITLACVEDACAPAHCVSGVQDEDETDVDCGGASCLRCQGGDSCAIDTDCAAPLQCTSGQCRLPGSCLDVRVSVGTASDGVYLLQPDDGSEQEAYCDMTTDDGGWTLVAASRGVPPADAAGDWHDELLGGVPTRENGTVWDGFRNLVGPEGDIRFTCMKDPQSGALDVDLSFYSVPWYQEITAGDDSQTCFNEADGLGFDLPAPRRQDNISGNARTRGTTWPGGYLEGEDRCGDINDFTVDFDDRGIGGDPADGTDWGMADGLFKCGDDFPSDGAWFIWVRQERPDCRDTQLGGDETDIDCGGSCDGCPIDGICRFDADCDGDLICTDGRCAVDPCLGICGEGCELCPPDVACDSDADCQSGLCVNSLCTAPTCTDLVVNGEETGEDCGGPDCPQCPGDEGCAIDLDCQSGRCLLGLCTFATCDDGLRNGNETDVDCGGNDCDPCQPRQGCIFDSDCDGGRCLENSCVALGCFDGIQSGLETGVDCGGPCAGCQDGDACRAGEDCASFYCLRQVCAQPPSCLAIATSARTARSGVYSITPAGDIARDVVCDMDTDGGGWTLIANSVDDPMQDAAGPYHDALADPFADTGADTIWDGLRTELGDKRADLRFSCRADNGDRLPAVDLVFYGVDWYQRLTAGTDADSCFNVTGEDRGPVPLPGRRDLIGDAVRGAGDEWRLGLPVGENTCDDALDFTVDFDDAGMDGDELDGTDWGADDGLTKCGAQYTDTGAFLIWLREEAPDCGDGVLNGEESDVDCGGSECVPCLDGDTCSVDSDCDSLACIAGVCAPAGCNDGRLNQDESDIDCGGSFCAPCVPGDRCVIGDDCDSNVCDATDFICLAPTCEDGVLNGDETDRDCGGLCDPCPEGGACAFDRDCETQACVAGVCVFDPCSNNELDLHVGETDVDCGGDRCGPCPGEAECTQDSDCQSRACEGDPGRCRIVHDCQALLEVDDGLPSGEYTVHSTDGSTSYQVLCDMDTDGGGWTLVAATRAEPLLDQAVSWHADLLSTTPLRPHDGVWDGLRDIVESRGDLRFSCKTDVFDAVTAVDLSFYGVDWYQEITNGDDADSCFNARNGIDNGTPPARRNNINGDTRPRGQQWNFGLLEGEDVCGDRDDFAIDFDDRGLDGDELDGTDWGEDDDAPKCGSERPSDGAWFVWARRSQPSCFDGVLSGDETDVDCGGSCPVCRDGDLCLSGDDCGSGDCVDAGIDPISNEAVSRCLVGECSDGLQSPGETGVDCGGACAGCPDGTACGENTDCASNSCIDSVCIEATCEDNVQNGVETGTDCGGPACPTCTPGQGCREGIDCDSGVCGEGFCLPPSCTDGVRNGDETGVDCGAGCPDCAVGQGCLNAVDCLSGTCDRGICVEAHCVNGVQDPTETDVDCGGGDCNGCTPGAFCDESDDCEAHFCRLGRCELAPSCLSLLEVDPLAPSGVYPIAPVPGQPAVEVYCDMRTDEGGWTLVASSGVTPLDDRAATWYGALGDLSPRDAGPGVWDGMRNQVGAGGMDLRFGCKIEGRDDKMDVDLSFYDVDWYLDMTTGTDAESCFHVEGAGGVPDLPARRDNVGGTAVPVDTLWRTGLLTGEDTCDDEGDFTVDLLDAGLDGDERDGTDWGEDDGIPKCGTEFPERGAWFIWFREVRPDCRDGVRGLDETGVDCGGLCPFCPAGEPCAEDSDCESLTCADGICTEARCDDGLKNGRETDTDCGGETCDPCTVNQACVRGSDCETDVCFRGECQAASCEDGLQNGDETDVDCGGSCDPCATGLRCDLDDDCEGPCSRNGFCLETHCGDGQQGNDETDVDCGGGACEPCDTGLGCVSSSDCAGGVCDTQICALGSSCQDILRRDPAAPSGDYLVQPGGAGDSFPVYCEMSVDGGGWTLVAASFGVPLNDQATDWHPGLRTIEVRRPDEVGALGIWGGLRDHVGERADLRFACRTDRFGLEFDVDLSVSGVDWYPELTAGSDLDSCFSEGDGSGYQTPAPARRDNIGGESRARGVARPTVFFEGEDACGDTGDFAIDFDDRALDGTDDATDWGEADNRPLCGLSTLRGGEGAWFIFVREDAPHCSSGAQDEDETGIDCGGSCEPCALNDACFDDTDCQSGFCELPVDPTVAGVCAEAPFVAEVGCGDGIRNGDESDDDCGGACSPCAEGFACLQNRDCQSGRCENGSCAVSTCDDGVRNGGESDTDCGGLCNGCRNAQSCIFDADCAEGRCRGGTCRSGFALGAACSLGTECESGYCDAGLCGFGQSCLQIFEADPSSPSGLYDIDPESAGESFGVRCDMNTDAGGWTLVGASALAPLVDAAGAWHAGLTSNFVEGEAPEIWNGLRERVSNLGTDLRFACKRDNEDAVMTVDLSFYDVDWYRVVTTGTDAQSCFNVPIPGQPAPPPPARRNNINGDFVARRIPWRLGALRGESNCADTESFTVDLQDAGQDGNERDGTDWGEDDGRFKCGNVFTGEGSWFLYVRENLRPCEEDGTCPAEPRCDDGEQNGDETGLDCGGSCAPCPEDDHCVSGTQDEDEAGVDCGGADCVPCPVSFTCDVDLDCGGANTCFELQQHDPSAQSGTYDLGRGSVYCDMNTDEGGWTLVAASLNAPLTDAASDYYTDLAALVPAAANAGVWDGLRDLAGERSDLRFTCKTSPNARDWDVDLSFDGNSWYQDITAGLDENTCFQESNGDGYDRPAPRRRDNVAGNVRSRGDDWGSGLFEGEDACDDGLDFAVDFDDRGIDGNDADGTDWGEDDGLARCAGSRGNTGAWFIWLREQSAHCSSGVRDGDETDVDCGGSCATCPEFATCGDDADCDTGACNNGQCGDPDDRPTTGCDDGALNGAETGDDCGGPECPACPAGQGCSSARDCQSGVCTDGVCADATCVDGVQNGSETDIDCGGSCDRCAIGDGCNFDDECQNDICRSGQCRPATCLNGTRDGDETDVDCGGSCPGCALGDACTTAPDCTTSWCENNTCAYGPSCAEILAANPAATSGTYTLAIAEVEGSVNLPVLCDMESDGGGWTLVSSSRTTPVDDARADWSITLTTQNPTAAMGGIWDGLRAVAPDDIGNTDLRFSCRTEGVNTGALDVDLVFYDVPWYTQLTAGDDAASCFSTTNNQLATPPARRDLIGGTARVLGSNWRTGALIGENSCGDTGDFTVDLEDAGMDGNELDGTDWGEDDGLPKCGATYPTDGAWLIWVR